MILVDTPVWIDHLKENNFRLSALVRNGIVLCHPLIVAELAMGSLRNRAEVLDYFEAFKTPHPVELEDVLKFVEREAIYSKGIGVIDATLLASCLMHRGLRLWTRDRRLNALAERFGIAYQPLH